MEWGDQILYSFHEWIGKHLKEQWRVVKLAGKIGGSHLSCVTCSSELLTFVIYPTVEERQEAENSHSNCLSFRCLKRKRGRKKPFGTGQRVHHDKLLVIIWSLSMMQKQIIRLWRNQGTTKLTPTNCAAHRQPATHVVLKHNNTTATPPPPSLSFRFDYISGPYRKRAKTGNM